MKEGDRMSVQAKTAGEGPGVLLEGNQKGSIILDIEGGRGGGGGCQSRVGGRGESNTSGTTDGFIATNIT